MPSLIVFKGSIRFALKKSLGVVGIIELITSCKCPEFPLLWDHSVRFQPVPRPIVPPGGVFVFIEHVAAEEGSALRLAQELFLVGKNLGEVYVFFDGYDGRYLSI